jgi:oxygen-independent coproporphyrinogen-3 oxidase
MVKTLQEELVQRKHEIHGIETIYFGGGTPSLLTTLQLKNILETIDENYRVSKVPEITLEANPDDLNPSKLENLKAAGVNRLSIGIQTFEEKHLTWMNRAHSAQEAYECVERAKKLGIDNISCDFIFGLPNQSFEDLKKDLNRFLTLDVPHISLYNLTVEEGTALHKWVANNVIQTADESLASDMFIHIREKLKENGYVGYEVSNFAKKNFESKHNSSYWKGKKYLGIGPSAHSYNGKERRWNVSNNNQYLKAFKEGNHYHQTERLSEKDLINEYILTRIRTIWGINKTEIDQIKPGTFHHCKMLLEKFSDKAIISDEQITLNEKGMLIADRISSELFVS